MEVFSLRFLWKALLGYSLTFACLFCLAVFGISVGSELRTFLRSFSLPVYLVYLIPVLLIAVVARYESRWIRRLKTRRRLSLIIILIAMVWWLSPVPAVLRTLFVRDAPAEAVSIDEISPGDDGVPDPPVSGQSPDLRQRPGPRGRP